MKYEQEEVLKVSRNMSKSYQCMAAASVDVSGYSTPQCSHESTLAFGTPCKDLGPLVWKLNINASAPEHLLSLGYGPLLFLILWSLRKLLRPVEYGDLPTRGRMIVKTRVYCMSFAYEGELIMRPRTCSELA